MNESRQPKPPVPPDVHARQNRVTELIEEFDLEHCPGRAITLIDTICTFSPDAFEMLCALAPVVLRNAAI